MNCHARWWITALALMATLAGCGGGGGRSEAGAKERWESQHGDALAALSTDLDAARDDLSRGDRALVLSSCNQLRTAVAETRDGLPVPDPAADRALRKALDQVSTGADDCVTGARQASEASAVEKAIAELEDARAALDEAQGAIRDW